MRTRQRQSVRTGIRTNMKTNNYTEEGNGDLKDHLNSNNDGLMGTMKKR